MRLSWTSVRGPSNFRSRPSATRSAGSTPANPNLPLQVSNLIHPDDPSTVASQPSLGVPSTGAATNEPGDSPTASSIPSAVQTPTSIPDADTYNREASARWSNTCPSCQNRLEPGTQCRECFQTGSQHVTSGTPNTEDGPVPVMMDQDTSPSDYGLGYSDITWLPPRRPASPSSSHITDQDHNHLDEPVPERASLRHFDVLPKPDIECQLLEHWTLYLCDALNPVPGIHNPLRTVMMPIALEGGREDAKRATGATALFHLICSASGFHLSQTKYGPESRNSLESLALEHHNLGITHLGKNIRSDDRTQCVSILASLLMCILMESITVPGAFWRLHFRGAMEWLNHINPQIWHQSESAAIIYQMFTGFASLAQSQLLLDGQNSFFRNLPYDPATQPQPYVLDTAIGLPQPILHGIRSMMLAQMRDKRSDGPTSADDAAQSSQYLDRLELELYLSVPKKPDPSIGKEFCDLVYHHGYTYYFAALLYMKRTVKDVPIQEVQPLIEQALQHVEALETSTNRPFCPMMWPIGLIAFETSHPMLQNRMLRCLEFLHKKSGLAIWTQITISIKGIWALRRREDNPDMKWHECMQTSAVDSFMLV